MCSQKSHVCYMHCCFTTRGCVSSVDFSKEESIHLYTLDGHCSGVTVLIIRKMILVLAEPNCPGQKDNQLIAIILARCQGRVPRYAIRCICTRDPQQTQTKCHHPEVRRPPYSKRSEANTLPSSSLATKPASKRNEQSAKSSPRSP